MGESSRMMTGTLPTGFALLQDPMRRLGEAIADFFAPEAMAVSTPRPVRSVAVELRAEPGADLQIEVHDDVLTVRGAILTIRGGGRGTAAEPQKYYY